MPDARVLFDRFVHHAERTRRAWAQAGVDRVRPLVDDVTDADTDAGLTRAIDGFRMIGAAFEEGRGLLARGRRRRAQGRRTDGNRDLAAARRIFEGRRLGTQPWRERANAAMRDHAGDPLAALTDRERAVVEAVADGATARQAAARLGRSERTVEWNLGRIYEKLGVGRRTELLALLRDLDPPSP